MRRFDSIVVGSGISGMTMALILGLNGRKVLLIEAAPIIGGSMSRFRLQGVPFDTGFHFSGGLEPGGILNDILRVLGIEGMIEPEFLQEDSASSLLFEDTGLRYDIPAGIDRIRRKLSGYFPSEAAAIDKYFMMLRDVCSRTPSMDLRRLCAKHTHIEEDFVSLQSVLDSLSPNRTLHALLSVFAMCYGTKPSEVSFANHARMSIGLYESMARVKDGGEAFIKAFKARARGLDIEIQTGCRISELAEIEGKRVKRFILSTGEEIAAGHCVFTIHPKGIIDLLPPGCVSPAFRERVSSFESSTGFFSVFSVLPDEFEEADFGRSLLTIMPEADINRMLDQGIPDSAILLMKSIELVHGRPRKVLSLFEPASVDSAARWADTTTGKRPEDYRQFKAAKTGRMIERICAMLPQYSSKIEVLDSASVLTFRDYLHSPDGSAYGIKQKLGQINLRSELPLRNLLAAGQSSLLPGIIGAMMSSFIVARSVLDGATLDGFIERGLGR